MTRLGAVFWGGLVLASGFATFNVKYAVQGIEDELVRAQRQTLVEQQEIRVLTAEWAYLNQPERLAELNRNFLQLAPMTARQLQGRVEEIALRAPPAGVPDTTPEIMFAATPPVAAPPVALLAAVLAPAAHAADIQGTETTTTAAGVREGVDSATDRAAALAEALRLLGIDAGGETPRVRLAQAAPVAGSRTPDPRSSETGTGEIQRADNASGGASAADGSEGRAALAEALRLLGIGAGGETPRVRLAKATPTSLDALISKIANTR
jgi:hypothetical protein